jgi:hypothetical protein
MLKNFAKFLATKQGLGLTRERDRTDDVAFVSGSKLLLTLRATYTPAVCECVVHLCCVFLAKA